MKPENIKCPKCDGPMVSRKSQYGIFWGCKDYPECNGTRDSMGMSKEDRENQRNNQNDLDEIKYRWDR